MKNIEVSVIDSHEDPSSMMLFLAKLTQRGHSIKNMNDLIELKESAKKHSNTIIQNITKLPHGTIKRFTPITVAIVGASRRFLAQARTHQVGINYVSASLQYSDYADSGQFTIPYEILKTDHENGNNDLEKLYIDSCQASMSNYKKITQATGSNDTGGYLAPQGLRNILIIQANHEAWCNFIRARACNRNTTETQYVTLRIWEELLKTSDGEDMFKWAGPDCMWGKCREGKMCCGNLLTKYNKEQNIPRSIINSKWPLLND